MKVAAEPVLPPLLSGHRLGAAEDPFAVAAARADDLEAGDLLWAPDPAEMRLALVLEPAVPRARCAEMLALAMVAFGDAAAVLIPAETPITYTWPNLIRLNGAVAASGRLWMTPEAKEPPARLVVGLAATMTPTEAGDPGHTPDRTTFRDEGCGDVTALALLDATARHLVAWLYRWEEDGFAPVQDAWWGRRDARVPLDRPGRLLGLDLHGNAMLESGGLAVFDAVGLAA